VIPTLHTYYQSRMIYHSYRSRASTHRRSFQRWWSFQRVNPGVHIVFQSCRGISQCYHRAPVTLQRWLRESWSYQKANRTRHICFPEHLLIYRSFQRVFPARRLCYRKIILCHPVGKDRHTCCRQRRICQGFPRALLRRPHCCHRMFRCRLVERVHPTCSLQFRTTFLSFQRAASVRQQCFHRTYYYLQAPRGPHIFIQ